jgi:hypothetical protein
VFHGKVPSCQLRLGLLLQTLRPSTRLQTPHLLPASPCSAFVPPRTTSINQAVKPPMCNLGLLIRITSAVRNLSSDLHSSIDALVEATIGQEVWETLESVSQVPPFQLYSYRFIIDIHCSCAKSVPASLSEAKELNERNQIKRHAAKWGSLYAFMHPAFRLERIQTSKSSSLVQCMSFETLQLPPLRPIDNQR